MIKPRMGGLTIEDTTPVSFDTHLQISTGCGKVW